MDVIDRYRNSFHFCVHRGWLNDPNGLSVYDGAYHLFYQHNPEDSKWGPMHWGHAVSEDLIRWTPRPIALEPDQSYDRNGCFSGSAAVDAGKHILLYTGNAVQSPENPAGARQVQCVAVGDGMHYRKLPANPVITESHLPPACSPADFRDPKLWKEGPEWFCMAATRDEQAGGQLLLFTARDLEHWRFVGVAASSQGRLGSMWECPDFFPLDGTETLVWSPQNVPQEDCRHQNIYSSVYSAGKLDRRTGVFDGAPPRELDFGPDFYAPQTLESPDGRRIMIAWMQMWERTMPTDELGHGWAGSMTIPRELHIEDGALIQRPVHELESYRMNPRPIEELVAGVRRVPEVRRHYLDLEIVLRPRGARAVGLIVKEGSSEGTRIAYLPGEGRLVLDRSRSGLSVRSTAGDRPDCQVYCCEVRPDSGVLSLRVILDRSSCELFADGGRHTMSATVYPAEESDGLSFFAEGGEAEVRGMAWDLRPPAESAT